MKDRAGEELARQRTTRLEARIEELERQLATYQSPLSQANFYEKVLDDLPIQLAVKATDAFVIQLFDGFLQRIGGLHRDQRGRVLLFEKVCDAHGDIGR